LAGSRSLAVDHRARSRHGAKPRFDSATRTEPHPTSDPFREQSEHLAGDRIRVVAIVCFYAKNSNRGDDPNQDITHAALVDVVGTLQMPSTPMPSEMSSRL